MSLIFISHSSKDNAAAAEIRRRLEAQGHHSVFLDFDPGDGIPAGRNWEQELYRQVRGCRAVVVVCSRHSMASRWCFMEITHARALGKHLFPVKVDDCELDGVLTDRQVVDVTAGDPDEAYARLWRGILAAGLDPADAFDWSGDRPPYPGLLSFQEEDAALFFGRDDETGDGLDLLNRVERLGERGLVMVLGASGSGKSSLVRAGLLPRLRRDADRWLVVDPFRPRDDPARELAGAFSRSFERIGRTLSWQTIHERLQQAMDLAEPAAAAGAEEGEPQPRTAAENRDFLEELRRLEASMPVQSSPRVARYLRLLRAAAEQGEAEGGGGGVWDVPTVDDGNPLVSLAVDLRMRSDRPEARVLLVLDQFEELLGHSQGHPASRFLRLLRAAVERPGSPLLVLATMRSDFLSPFQSNPALIEMRYESLSLGPMTPDDVAQTIEKPAAVASIDLEPGLVQAMVDDVRAENALPLLAFTLRELYERYGGDRLLEVGEYRDGLGGLQGSVAKAADALLPQRAGDDVLAPLRAAFLSLVRVTDDGRYARRSARWSDLPAAAGPLLERFVAARLLVSGGDGAERTLEVAHEALFEAWGQLAGWLEESREALHLHGQLSDAARQWREGARADDYLWRKGRLHRALELRGQGQLPLAPEELEFLSAAERAERAELRWRRIVRVALIGSALAVAVVMSFFYVAASFARREAEERLVNSLATLAREGQHSYDTALLLASEASAIRDTFETRKTLVNLLMKWPQLEAFFHGHEAVVHSVAFSGDGKVLAAGGADGQVRLWDLAAEPRELEPIPQRDTVLAIAFGPDSAVPGIGGDRGIFQLTGDETFSLAADLGQGSFFAVAFDRGLRTLAAGGTDGTVWVASADGSGGFVAGRAEARHAGFVTDLAFSADGLLASASRDGTVKVWQMDAGGPALVDELVGGIVAGAHCAVFHPQGSRYVVAGEGGGRLVLWDRGTQQRAEVPAHRDAVEALAFTADGRHLASGSIDGTLRVWGWTADADGTPRLVPGLETTDLKGGVRSLAFSPDGRYLATGSRNGTVRLWSLETRPAVFELTDQRWEVRGFGFSADGRVAATGDVDGVVRLWDLASGRQKLVSHRQLPRDQGEVNALALSGDARALAAAGSGHRNQIRVWDLDPEAGGTVPRITLEGEDAWVLDVALSDDRRHLAAVVSGEVRVVDDRGARIVLRQTGMKLSAARSVAFDALTGHLASGHDDGGVRLWNPSTGALLREIAAAVDDAVQVMTLAFSVDGRALAAGRADGTVLLWDVEARAAVPRRLRGQDGEIRSVAFSHDGSKLAAGASDSTIRLWSVAEEEPVALTDLLGHTGIVYRVAFVGDDELLSGAEDRTIRRWDVRLTDVARARELARRRANRELGDEEWEEFFGSGLPRPVIEEMRRHRDAASASP